MSHNRRVTALEAKAVAAERSISTKTSNKGALEAAISSAELYMQALKLSDDSNERKRLNIKLSELIAKAEDLKEDRNAVENKSSSEVIAEIVYPTSTRSLSKREEIILLEGSKLNGAIFKPWKGAPDSKEFELKPGEDYYTEAALSLSQDQLRSFAGWERATEAIKKIKLYKDGSLLPNEPIMNLPGRPDLVQDMASDCSVVASLCAGTARAEKGHTRILGTIVHPYENSDQSVKISPNGKYVLRLYFNGCWRRVEIDDLLPTSKTSRVLHVVDRSHPGLLWPALMEKAYLKVRGGYDFPGSNSGTDLAVFTSWIPQQVFLHDEDVDQSALWSELAGAFEHGNVLLTIGTGKLSRREQRQLGLAAQHDYAIVDMKNREGIKEMLIKNPWSDGEVWKGASRRKPNPNHESDEFDLPATAEDSLEMLPGTFWMDYNSVFHHFENLYINWNPALFSYRQDLHFAWQTSESSSASHSIFTGNPQFLCRLNQGGDIWFLLSRHFRTGDYTHANSGKNGFISLYVYDKQGYRVLSAEDSNQKGPFVDSPNTLLRFSARGQTTYTIVVVSQDLPQGKHNFTLSALAHTSIELGIALSRYQNEDTRSAAWTRHTAGGNTDSPQYLKNPQFAISVSSKDTSIALVLQVLPEAAQRQEECSIHVKLLLLYSPTQPQKPSSDARVHRIDKLRNRDIVASSGNYRQGNAMVETTLNPGFYTAVCSTFDENQQAKFSLTLYTSDTSAATLVPVPSESSGRLSINSGPATFDHGVSRLIAPLTIPRIGRAIFIAHAKQIPGSRASSSSSLYRMSLVQGRGPYANVLATSSTPDTIYSSIYTNLRIRDIDLGPSLHGPGSGGLWLVLERPSQSIAEGGSGSIYLEVEILAEERLQLGGWQVEEV